MGEYSSWNPRDFAKKCRNPSLLFKFIIIFDASGLSSSKLSLDKMIKIEYNIDVRFAACLQCTKSRLFATDGIPILGQGGHYHRGTKSDIGSLALRVKSTVWAALFHIRGIGLPSFFFVFLPSPAKAKKSIQGRLFA